MSELWRSTVDGPGDPDPISEHLSRQCGVISRAQVHAAGEAVWDIRRRLRRREWVRLLDGVYLDHTGEPTWLQRSRAGVLRLWPAALAGRSAVRALLGPGWRAHDERGPIEVAVARDRRVSAPPGYRVRRTTHLDQLVSWNAGPPRVRAACARRGRLRRRVWLSAILDDIAEGTGSVLEHGYLTRIERAHGLPRGRPCRTTQRLVVLLRSRGWEVSPVPCGPVCPWGPCLRWSWTTRWSGSTTSSAGRPDRLALDESPRDRHRRPRARPGPGPGP